MASEAAAITAPVAGTVVPLAAVPDPVFSSGAMGKGLAVLPTEGKVYSPVSGTVTAQMPHAYGITADNGMEVLIHIGIDTVKLEGKHFSPEGGQGPAGRGRRTCSPSSTSPRSQAAGYNPMVIMVVHQLR